MKNSQKWTVWSQHWIGYKPREWNSYESEKEAIEAARKLNESPSGQWYHYFVRPPRTQQEVIAVLESIGE